MGEPRADRHRRSRARGTDDPGTDDRGTHHRHQASRRRVPRMLEYPENIVIRGRVPADQTPPESRLAPLAPTLRVSTQDLFGLNHTPPVRPTNEIMEEASRQPAPLMWRYLQRQAIRINVDGTLVMPDNALVAYGNSPESRNPWAITDSQIARGIQRVVEPLIEDGRATISRIQGEWSELSDRYRNEPGIGNLIGLLNGLGQVASGMVQAPIQLAAITLSPDSVQELVQIVKDLAIACLNDPGKLLQLANLLTQPFSAAQQHLQNARAAIDNDDQVVASEEFTLVFNEIINIIDLAHSVARAVRQATSAIRRLNQLKLRLRRGRTATNRAASRSRTGTSLDSQANVPRSSNSPTPTQAPRPRITDPASFRAQYGNRLEADPGTLENMYRRTRGENPVHTRAHAHELFTVTTLLDHGMPDGRSVARLRIIGSSSRGPSPDLYVTFSNGTSERIEITAITSARRGRSEGLRGPRSQESIQAHNNHTELTRNRIHHNNVEVMRAALERKIDGRQLSAPIQGVPPGGTLIIHSTHTGFSNEVMDEAVAAISSRASLYVQSIIIYIPVSTSAGGRRVPRMYNRTSAGIFHPINTR